MSPATIQSNALTGLGHRHGLRPGFANAALDAPAKLPSGSTIRDPIPLTATTQRESV